jgi:hypothetical protein
MIYLNDSGKVLMSDLGLVKCECCDDSYASVGTCESEEINPVICGYSELTGAGIVASVPPKKYLKRTNKWEKYDIKTWLCCPETSDNPGYHVQKDFTLLDPAPYVWLYDPAVNCYSATLIQEPSGCFEAGYHGTYSFTNLPCNGSQTSGTACIPNTSGMTFSNVTTTRREGASYQEAYFSGGSCDGQLESQSDKLYSSVLSEEDTEQDAIDRETPTTGTSCSSLWETRSTGFTFTKRTSGYTIQCSSLTIGVEYRVTPEIRKRTAVIGSYGAWENVTVTPTIFTATATTETIDNGGNPIDLDHVQGYEYEITGARVNPT